MSRRQSAAVEKALKEYWRTLGDITRISVKHGIAPSSLYRAIKPLKQKERK